MDNLGFVALIVVIENEEEVAELRINRRTLRDVSDPFTLPESTFKGIYRMSRDVVRELLHEILPHMPVTQRNTSIPDTVKVFAALHFFTQGSYQKGVGLDHSLSMCQASVSNCIRDVNSALRHLTHIIEFPNTEEKCRAEKLRFMELPNAYPGIIGAIDCTHVAIIAPPVADEEAPAIVFYNRKGFYSINVQVICNAELRILALNARYPGSVHDSAIWSSSVIRQEVARMYNVGQRNFWIIGDSGYPVEPWLMTTFGGENLTNAERRFNIAHRSTRNVIGRFNGVWKGRFRCILKHRVLHYSPVTAANIINSCAILHNFAAIRGEIDVDDVEEERDDDHDDAHEVDVVDINVNNEGRAVRNRIVNQYFT